MGTQDPAKLTMTDEAGKTMVSVGDITKAGKFTGTWLRGN